MAKVTVSFLENILDKKKHPITLEVMANTVLDALNIFSEETNLIKKLKSIEIIVYLNNTLVKFEDWETVKINENDSIEFMPVIGAVMGAGAAMFWAAYGGYIIAAGVSLVVGAATSYAMQRFIANPNDIDVPDFEFNETTPNYSWSGASTKAQEGIPIPIIYGTHCTGGNIVSEELIYSDGKSALNLLIALGEAPLGGAATTDATNFCVNDQPWYEYDDFEDIFTSTFFSNGLTSEYVDGSSSVTQIRTGTITAVNANFDRNISWEGLYNLVTAEERYNERLDSEYWNGPSDYDPGGYSTHNFTGSTAWAEDYFYTYDDCGYLTHAWTDEKIVQLPMVRNYTSLNFNLAGNRAILLLRYYYVYTEADGSHAPGDRYVGTGEGSGWGEYGTNYRYFTNMYEIIHRYIWNYWDDGQEEFNGFASGDYEHTENRIAETTSDLELAERGFRPNHGWTGSEPYFAYPGLYLLDAFTGWTRGTPYRARSHRQYTNANTLLSIPFPCPQRASDAVDASHVDPFLGLPDTASVRIEIVRIDNWPYSLELQTLSSSESIVASFSELSLVYFQFSNATDALSGTAPTFKIPVTGLSNIDTWTYLDGEAVYVEKTWSNNPVWCLINLLTNKRYGFGEFITINDFDLDIAAQTAVLAANYPLNIILDSTLSFAEAIEAILDSFCGILTTTLTGKIRILMDAPIGYYPSQVVTQADIVGDVVYSFNSVKDTPNALEVRIADLDNYYIEKAIFIDIQSLYTDSTVHTANAEYAWSKWSGSPSAISQIRLNTINLRGVTSIGQGWAIGHYKLAKAIKQSQFISFKMRPSALNCEPGDVILVQDPLIAATYGGIIQDIVLETPGDPNSRFKFILDQNITLTDGMTYYMYCSFTGLSSSGEEETEDHSHVAGFDFTASSIINIKELYFENTSDVATLVERGRLTITYDSSSNPISCTINNKNNLINYAIVEPTLYSLNDIPHDPAYTYGLHSGDYSLVTSTLVRVTTIAYDSENHNYNIEGIVYDPTIYPKIFRYA